MNCSESCGNQNALLWSLFQPEGLYHPINWMPHRSHSHRPPNLVVTKQRAPSSASPRKHGINTLPNEMLAEILKMFAKSDEHLRIITAVCQTWREIALTTPRLWTCWTVCITPRTCVDKLNFARDCLERSGGLPIRISLSIASESHRLPAVADLIDAIAEETVISRCCSLKYHGPSKVLSRFHDASKAPKLHSLLLDLRDPHYISAATPLNLGPTTKPSSLYLHCFPLTSLTMGWSNLTTITAFSMFGEDVLKLLSIAHSLTECRLMSLQNVPHALTMGDKTISHPTLHCLHANFSAQFYRFPSAITDFFNLITLPNLTTLSLEFPIYNVPRLPIEPLIAFLERSGSSLKSLSLATAQEMDGEDLIDVCLAIPQLTTLDLWFRKPCRYNAEVLLGPFFERLCLDPEQREIAADEVPILPLLQTFTLEMHGDFPWRFLPGILSPFNDGTLSTHRPLQKVAIKCYVDLEEKMNDSDSDYGSESCDSSDSNDYEGDITPDGESTPAYECKSPVDGRSATINKFRRLRAISYALIPDWDTYDMLWDCRKQLRTFQLFISSDYQSHHEWDLFELSCLLLDLDDPQ